MSRLTSQLLENFPYSRHADPGSIQKGRAYYKDGRVEAVDLESDMVAVCVVNGDSGDYSVEISVDKKSGALRFTCDCPYADDGNFCKHMVAAGLELKDYLDEEELEWSDDEADDGFSPRRPAKTSQNWEQRLDQTLALGSGRSTSHTPSRYVALVLLSQTGAGLYGYGGSYYSHYSAYSLVPFIIKAREWSAFTNGEDKTPQEINDLLAASKKWLRAAEKMHQQANPLGCLNLTPEAVSILNLLSNSGHLYGFSHSSLPVYLPMLARIDIPVFLGDAYAHKLDRPLHILPEPVGVEIDLRRADDKLLLQAGYDYGGQFNHISKKIEILSSSPAWVLMDDHVAQLRNAEALSILASFPIDIPARQSEIFRERYFAKVAQTLPIRSNFVEWQDVRVETVPRLYLRDDQDRILRAHLRFGYGEHELLAARTASAYAVETQPNSWALIRIHRKLEREQEIYQLLAGPAYRLKRADSRQPFGTYELRARVHPFDFLLRVVPLLTQAGFEIYGEDKLKLGRINRSAPTLRVSLTSGIDWFDLRTIVEFGDQQTSFHDLRKALKRGEQYIKLADGSVGQIPAEWLAKYRHLWNLAEETVDGFRVNDVHLSLLDSLFDEDATLQPPPDLIERRERLHRFDQIKSQSLPVSFTGQLRPYQKHGFDWLHFLHDYKLGGILADDMGLGKTIQVLAYLQSLRELRATGSQSAASLLVVPKSLIANWQREAERFTPGLRFLEYMGNIRSKDTALFNNFDVVLTTYGTMLRDVEILHAYHFHHIILDESQAIKNPLAKSARAARLLKADHRIVMTGTPVENNTFELWSQFAFLNPGLLGNMDYFKREFANRIESDGDEKTAEMLRKLIYPFILRRTKEQVAPELPPRTERIVYTDMDSAQKKLYAQTRERYRAELLGLIESDGLNDARFKILEGLLRLRQIAIHPALVDKKYKGPAPKFEILLEIMETLQAEHHKALIFSQFVETLKLVRQELDTRKIKYLYLDGQTSNRQARVDSFQNDPSYPFFLISLRAGGVGLNLTAADYVIHLDPWWNPAVEIQASDRAHRIGQDKPVFIYRIIARDTVEEKILQLQEKKRALVKSLISTEASFFKSLTRDDVKMLFD